MGRLDTIKTKCWRKFLEEHECYFYKEAKGSHQKWKKKGSPRSIIFRPADKEVPLAHLKSNLETLGISKVDFLTWVNNNC